MNTFIRVKGFASLLSLLAMFLLWASPVQASSGPTVVNENTGNKYSDLQLAINNANSGDTLKLSGLFTGPFTIAKSITLKGSKNAVLDGNNAVRVLDISTVGNISVTLDHLTIQNGNATFGAGILNAANLTLNFVNVINNTATGSPGGGGIANWETVPITLVHGDANLTILNSTISGNSAPAGPGGGIRTQAGSLIMENSNVSDNTSLTIGGGLALFDSVNTISESQIADNTASEGGGIAPFDGGVTTLIKVSVNGNTAVTGGGVLNQDTALTIKCSNIFKNTATGSGGGLAIVAGGSTIVNRSCVKQNAATISGGGIFSESGISLIVLHSEVENNTPDDIFD